jgi:Coenzyme PQQ synthesis protein D (PqqD)
MCPLVHLKGDPRVDSQAPAFYPAKSACSSMMKRNDDVISRPFGDAAVLVDLATNQVFELNRTASRIWELLGDGLDRPAIVEALVQEFDVDRAKLQIEVDDLLDELRRQNLILEADASTRPRG